MATHEPAALPPAYKRSAAAYFDGDGLQYRLRTHRAEKGRLERVAFTAPPLHVPRSAFTASRRESQIKVQCASLAL